MSDIAQSSSLRRWKKNARPRIAAIGRATVGNSGTVVAVIVNVAGYVLPVA